ncbi:hypothetical protein, partial [Serratia marcescens]|uniref:hypothetical protein n=1 Tax=Serratia marcescens TaxID=615 RepID=UPI0018A81FBB
AYCLKTQPATGETYPKSDLFNKALGQDYRDVLKDFEKDEIDNYLNVKDNKIDEQPKPEEGDESQPNQSE